MSIDYNWRNGDPSLQMVQVLKQPNAAVSKKSADPNSQKALTPSCSLKSIVTETGCEHVMPNERYQHTMSMISLKTDTNKASTFNHSRQTSIITARIQIEKSHQRHSGYVYM